MPERRRYDCRARPRWTVLGADGLPCLWTRNFALVVELAGQGLVIHGDMG